MKKSILVLMYVSVLIFAGSCSKEGPMGPQGPQGPSGQQGVQGIPGEDGNANVHSYTYLVATSDWNLEEPNYYVNLYVPEITQSVMDEGAVLVYMGNGSGDWLALPFTEWYDGFGHLTNQVISFENITIWVSDSDLFQTDNPGNQTFKVVVIEGSLFSAMPAGINLSNYKQTKDYLNLK